jgi:hypothetical protein
VGVGAAVTGGGVLDEAGFLGWTFKYNTAATIINTNPTAEKKNRTWRWMCMTVRLSALLMHSITPRIRQVMPSSVSTLAGAVSSGAPWICDGLTTKNHNALATSKTSDKKRDKMRPFLPKLKRWPKTWFSFHVKYGNPKKTIPNKNIHSAGGCPSIAPMTLVTTANSAAPAKYHAVDSLASPLVMW